MANSRDPQNLVEKIVRYKISQTLYWKNQCLGLTAATLVNRAMELDHVGGTFGCNRKPTSFLCLVLKMLEIQPDKDIVVEFIKNDNYEYVRVLGALYLRLTGTDADIYSYLEPLYNDYRRLRLKLPDGKFGSTHVDEFIDELLTKDYSCDIALPCLTKRWILVSLGALEPRKSVFEDVVDQIDDIVLDDDYYQGKSRPSRSRRDLKRRRDHSNPAEEEEEG
ncbi:hypothetical protein PTKIN_Ptkin03bG0234300 [Pterospermum kingtungense]